MQLNKAKILQVLEKNILSVFIRTGIFLILAILSVILLGSRVKKINSELIEKRSRLVSAASLVDNLVNLRNDEKKAEIVLPKIKDTLPDADDVVVKTLPDLESAALKNNLKAGITLQDVSVSSDLEPSGVNFAITLAGTGPSFLTYLQELENLPYFIRVVNIDLRSGAGIVNPSEINFSGKIYIKE